MFCDNHHATIKTINQIWISLKNILEKKDLVDAPRFVFMFCVIGHRNINLC
jgi:hypothetical protein